MTAPITQVYDVVNSVVSQSMGITDLTAVDETGLIALGNTIMNSSTFTNDFVEGLVDRIGKTIFSYRKYNNKFSGLMRDNFTWGAVLQKIKVDMPEAEIDESYGLVDTKSIDMYKVAKPTAKQKLFYTQTPYQFHITIKRDTLKNAFTSESAMGSFISCIYGEVQNKIELALEDMGRNCLNNYIGELSGGVREIKLVTEYNTLFPPIEPGSNLTATTAMQDVKFLKYASQRIQELSSLMTEMTQGIFNDNTVSRHTPKDLQRMYILKKFSQALETNVLANAFHKEYDALGDYQEVNFWQSIQKPNEVNVNRASDSANKNVKNIIGILMDYEAAGIYKTDEWTSSTPFNSAGGYMNTYWHEKNLYFNDLSENGLILTLN